MLLLNHNYPNHEFRKAETVNNTKTNQNSRQIFFRPQIGKTKSLIEKNWLDELMAGRAVVAREIRDNLQGENPGLEISYFSTSRFVRAIKNSAGNDTELEIRVHLNRAVAVDPDALEGLESMCAAWAREAGLDQARRIARAVKGLSDGISRWVGAEEC